MKQQKVIYTGGIGVEADLHIIRQSGRIGRMSSHWLLDYFPYIYYEDLEIE